MKNIKSYEDFLIESNLNDDVNEGKLKNLALAGIITAASLASGNKAYSQDRLKDNIKNKIETVATKTSDIKDNIKNNIEMAASKKSDVNTDKNYDMETYEQAYKRMSKEKGFGEGKSPNLDFSKRIATNQARGNLAKSEITADSLNSKKTNTIITKTTMTGVDTVEQKTYKDENGNYITIIVVDYK